ncbi:MULTISPECIES: CvpA family protein [Psychrilyobacter]|uniref:CvpA family protein n=1 Tax=Psychrilyobacter piezotolerans TaxID=2293438 RepID=A0ABX9KGG1_9FUSO|nr:MULTISPECIES: CvpA family protein [Psychrilyobacter]MCS5421522.1 CvpA family protein [Psychrilyobacter sp. S5]NDI77749.1 CvpA family protein [Psychrilyobacter piezotolerans]RDE61447.1 CvpA family protein [Psychrilyobacter sp. S5]REI40968.1 CvpA family protein [Psychrilyobacter piezotolerans]
MYIDIAAGIILVLGVLMGFKKGFFFEVLSFFILILNVVLAKKWTPYVYEYVSGTVNINENVLYFLTYLALLTGLYMASSVILSVLRKILPKMFMGLTDSILGGVLGGLKGGFIIFVLLIFFNLLSSMSSGMEGYSKDSRVNKFFLKNVTKLEGYYPEAVKEKLEELEFRKSVEKQIKEYMSK